MLHRGQIYSFAKGQRSHIIITGANTTQCVAPVSQALVGAAAGADFWGADWKSEQPCTATVRVTSRQVPLISDLFLKTQLPKKQTDHLNLPQSSFPLSPYAHFTPLAFLSFLEVPRFCKKEKKKKAEKRTSLFSV